MCFLGDGHKSKLFQSIRLSLMVHVSYSAGISSSQDGYMGRSARKEAIANNARACRIYLVYEHDILIK